MLGSEFGPLNSQWRGRSGRVGAVEKTSALDRSEVAQFTSTILAGVRGVYT